MRTRTLRTTNRLLAALPLTDGRRLLAECEQVELVFEDVLAAAGEQCRHVYFPTGGFISVVAALDGRPQSRLEVGMVGNEGMLGTSLILDVSTTPLHAVVQGAGTALRMGTVAFRRELGRSPALQRRLNRYVYVLMNQLAQAALCTRYHVVQARLARWLLMTRDRAYRDQFRMTHEFLAHMLGVRRAGVTRAAGSLERLDLIEYRRGHINILDNAGLQKVSCRCYRDGIETYDRVLGVDQSAVQSRRRLM